jgi:hypothetical protein
VTPFDKERSLLAAAVKKANAEQDQAAASFAAKKALLATANRRLFDAELALFLFDKRHPFAEGATPNNPTPNFPEAS